MISKPEELDRLASVVGLPRAQLEPSERVGIEAEPHVAALTMALEDCLKPLVAALGLLGRRPLDERHEQAAGAARAVAQGESHA